MREDHIKDYRPLDSFGSFDFDFSLFMAHYFPENGMVSPLDAKERDRALKVVGLLQAILEEIVQASYPFDSYYTSAVFNAINPKVNLRHPTPEEKELYGPFSNLQGQIRPILVKLEGLKTDLIYRNTIDEADRAYWLPLLTELKDQLRPRPEPIRHCWLCA